jgi:hypothetical protein
LASGSAPTKDTLDGQAKVIYRSKDGRASKTFQVLDWLVQLALHIPNKGEQMVRCYGYYSNKSRGMRKKAGSDVQVPALVEPAASITAFRRNWARLIQKIYQMICLARHVGSKFADILIVRL